MAEAEVFVAILAVVAMTLGLNLLLLAERR
jgi:hypothetical protein